MKNPKFNLFQKVYYIDRFCSYPSENKITGIFYDSGKWYYTFSTKKGNFEEEELYDKKEDVQNIMLSQIKKEYDRQYKIIMGEI